MQIQKITAQPSFNGKVYVGKNLSIRDMEKLNIGASKINAFAETRNCDFTIFRTNLQKGLSIFAKKLDTQKDCTMEVLGYPSSSTMNDIDKIIATMRDADDSFKKSKVDLGWVCE